MLETWRNITASTPDKIDRGSTMNKNMRLLLVVVLIVLLLGLLPLWPYSTGWGYYPSGGVGLLLIVIIVLLVMQNA